MKEKSEAFMRKHCAKLAEKLSETLAKASIEANLSVYDAMIAHLASTSGLVISVIFEVSSCGDKTPLQAFDEFVAHTRMDLEKIISRLNKQKMN
jgi:hypothetical protein